MFSPFRIELKTKLTTTESKQYYAINYIRTFVVKNKGEDIIVSENCVSFKSGFFGWSWDTFSQLDKGVFILNKDELIFRFHFIKAYIFFGIFFSFVAYQSKNISICILFFAIFMTINWLTANAKYKKLLQTLSIELNNNKITG